MIPIEGRGVVLRDIRLDDLDAYAAWHKPGHLWQDYDGPDLNPPRTPEQAATEIAETVARIRAHIETGRFAQPRSRLVIADRTSDRLVGTVSRYLADEQLGWQAVGIVVFDDRLWGRGLGYEALGLWVEYQFRANPDWHRVMMSTWSGNLRMARLAASLGFVEEARYRRARRVRGEWYDSLGYGILREEWASRYPDGFAAHLGI